MSTREERFRVIDAHVFRTITGEDWRRALADARARPNAVLAQIREKILAMNLGKSESGTISKNHESD